MASLDVIALDPVTPQLRAPGVGDTYHFCRVVEFQDGTASEPSITNVGDTNTGIYFPSADTIAFAEGGVEAMRLDSAGNLGLGVVPNTWSANNKAIQITRGAVLSSRTNELHFAFAVNDYVASDGIDRYIENGFATSYVQDNTGTHSWYVAASGIANNAISFTRAMVINSSANVGIGTASPAFKLDVIGTGKVSALYLTDMTAGAGALYYNAGAENRLTLANYNVGGTIFFETNGGTYAGAIDASQNWGIGTTTPNVRLDVAGAMRLRGSTSGYVGLQAAAVAGTTTYTLPSADGSNGQVLTTNGTGTLSWTTNAGGDVTGPASASDNAIARFDGTTGKLIQNSAVFVDDDGDVGIGTSTPGEKLQIESGTPRIYMNATTNSASAGMYFRVKDGSGNADNSGIYVEPTANIANRYINFSASNIGSDMAIRAGGNVGIGVITPDVKLRIDAVSPTRGIIETVRGTGSTGSQIAFAQDAVADWVIGQPAGVNAFAFWSGRNPSSDGTERMRLDSSGNLGLGVTPSAWGGTVTQVLQLKNGAHFAGAANSFAQVGANSYFDGTNYKYVGSSFASRYLQNDGVHQWFTAPSGTAGNNITFTQAMTLDSSGNLGLGVTPSAWSQGRAFEVLQQGYGVWNGTGSAYLLANTYFNSGFKYANTGAAATHYYQFQGAHVWSTAPSGTAGNAITFTQAMTLDASGNLGIGTGSPLTRLHLSSSSATYIQITDEGDGASRIGQNGTALTFGVDLANGATERARITNAGNFLVGTTTDNGVRADFLTSGNTEVRISTSTNIPGQTNTLRFSSIASSSSFAGGGAYIQSIQGSGIDNYSLAFGTSLTSATATERARITNDGYWLVGTTTGGLSKVFHNNSGTNAFQVANTSTNTASSAMEVNVDYTGNTTGWFIRGGDNALYRFYIYTNGNITNTNGSYGTISDAKVKTDIVDAGSQWDDFKAVRFRKFKMKDDPTGLVQLGVVAQELEQTSPGLVDEHADRDAKGNDLGTTTKSVKTSVLLMKAAVALQEAMARIEQLEAKVAALEAK